MDRGGANVSEDILDYTGLHFLHEENAHFDLFWGTLMP